jgi:hypothetical protein
MANTTIVTKSLTIALSVPAVVITTPLDSGGNGTLDATEDTALAIHGTSTDIPIGSLLNVTVTDGSISVSDAATVSTGGTWSLAAINVRAFANGILAVTASYTAADGSTYDAGASATHDKGGTVTIDSITTDTGLSSDFITSDATLYFTGSAAAIASVTLTLTNSGGTVVFNPLVTANASGLWTYNYSGSTLPAGTYGLKAVSGSYSASQNLTVDTAAPAGSLTVDSLITNSTTPILTGTATVAAGETLSVTVNGITYTVLEGNLALIGGNWSLAIPPANALMPAVASGGFNGKYDVTVVILDVAGNPKTVTVTQALTIQDTTGPVVDLDPSNAGTVNLTRYNTAGFASKLYDDADPATVTEASGLVTNITITITGLANGSDETVIFGSTPSGYTIIAGSSGVGHSRLVGGMRMEITHAAGAITLSNANGARFTVAEAQAAFRDIWYQNTAITPTVGARSFAVTMDDTLGNRSASATATLTVQRAPVAPTLIYYRATNLTMKIKIANLLTNCSDADGDALTFAGLGTSANGATLTASAAYIYYTPPVLPGNKNKDDSFTYTISDNHGGTATGTITIIVNLQKTSRSLRLVVNGSTATVSFMGIAGSICDVQRATNPGFTQGLSVLGTITFPASGQTNYMDIAAPSPNAYYRLVAH